MDANFGAADFVVFVACLLTSAFIGVFYAYKDRNEKSTESYLYANGQMNMVWVTISMGASWASAITVLAFPGEVFLFGNVSFWLLMGQIIGNGFAAIYFVSFIRRLRVGTMYEYLEMRFNRKLRILCTVLSSAQQFFYMGIAVYLPALALTVATPLSLEWSIVLTSTLCTFYTSMGGVKAVIWTDVFQSTIMLLGMAVVFFKAVAVMGGIEPIREAATRGGRDNFFAFTADPRVQNSLLAWIIGYTHLAMYGSTVGQPMIQRYLCCKTDRQAQLATGFHVFIIGTFVTLSGANGLAMYAFFEDCNPKDVGIVQKNDQILPIFVMTLYQSVAGIPGVFVASVYCGTLSTISSGVNSLASVILNDVVLLVRPKMSSRARLVASKILSVLIGAIVMLMAFIASLASDTMVQLSVLFNGSLCGTILGIIILGTFFPFVNTKAANISFVAGASFGLWMLVGKTFFGRNSYFNPELPRHSYGCQSNESFTTEAELEHATIVAFKTEDNNGGLANTLYSLSSLYIGLFVTTVTMVTGLFASIFTRKELKDADPFLFIPLCSNKRFPAKMRKAFRFGLPEDEECKDKFLAHESNELRLIES